MDLRQHRKMIMIDNYIAYTGSMNMVDPRFFKQDAGVGQWVDLMARMEGPVATAMGIVYSCDWEIETGKRILPRHRTSISCRLSRPAGTPFTQLPRVRFPRRLDSSGAVNRSLFSARIFNYDHALLCSQRRFAACNLYGSTAWGRRQYHSST